MVIHYELHVFHVNSVMNILYLYDKPADIHLLFVIMFSHIILQQHVLVTPVTIVRVSYNNNTINLQRIVQKCMIKPLDFL